MSAPVTLMVIAKSPRPGRVKTRLCPPMSPEEAAAIAEAALADTLEVIGAVRARRHVLFLEGPVGPWLPPGFDVLPQSGGALDERLTNAFAAVDGPGFLVGMDTPQLTTGHISNAVDTLLDGAVDAVLGPATDGGWWGIGMRAPDPAVFFGVEMSTAHTCKQQRARLASLGLHTEMLDELRDVDDFDDALAVAALAPSSRFARTLSAVTTARSTRAMST